MIIQKGVSCIFLKQVPFENKVKRICSMKLRREELSSKIIFDDDISLDFKEFFFISQKDFL